LPNTKKGSALVLTLMVVSLLLVIVLALVAHVRMELRNVTNHQAHRVAQQNAVLALNLG
jgi:type II secretory pathway component PulK